MNQNTSKYERLEEIKKTLKKTDYIGGNILMRVGKNRAPYAFVLGCRGVTKCNKSDIEVMFFIFALFGQKAIKWGRGS